MERFYRKWVVYARGGTDPSTLVWVLSWCSL